MLAVLAEARRLGFLGPGPVDAHLAHAAGFAAAVGAAVGVVVPVEAGGESSSGSMTAADLGSGAGLPGLPLALGFPAWSWVLIEASERRAAFLRQAIVGLGLAGRVRVLEERAEVAGRDSGLRSRLDLVVARSFGPPAVVAECAAPLLRLGGRAVVSEPPGGVPCRWPDDGLALLGMSTGPAVHAGGGTFQLLRQSDPCADRYPRRTGIPAKRPLF